MRVYTRRAAPRTVYLSTNEYVLSFRLPQDAELANRPSAEATVVVEFQPAHEVDLGPCELVADCFGCIGLIDVANDVFLCVISARSRAAVPTPRRTVWAIHDVEFFSLKSSFAPQDEEHPCAALRKLIAQGGFFYSSDFDLTARIENGDRKPPQFSTPADGSFMWNRFMTAGLREFREKMSHEDRLAIDNGGFLTTLIRGFASTIKVKMDDTNCLLTVLSRQSWLRAGTRYHSRGIDDDGNVANFVETETVLWMRNGLQFGFVQLRGSVPLFWEQDPQLLSAKIAFTRSLEATRPAFVKHFENLFDRFGSVHIIDLLGSPTGSRGSSARGSVASVQTSSSGSSAPPPQQLGTVSEADLSLRYQSLAEGVPNLCYTHFDFHKEVAGVGYQAASKLVDRVQDSMLEFGFYSYNPVKESTETEQIGVFRVNCLDCLDRTNLVQQLVSKDALELFLDYHDIYSSESLWTAHSTLWADNGDQLSQNYTGTGALKSSFTRSGRMNLAGALSDVSKSVSRLYINNFVDKSRQAAIEYLLGKHEGQTAVAIFDPINDHVREEMQTRKTEYQTQRAITVFAGTFNVNGKSFSRDDPSHGDIVNWLFPPEVSVGKRYPDLYLIGFQELVELTTSQILNVDPSKKADWENLVSDCLNSRDEEYVLMRSGQLVGVAIMMFVKKSEMQNMTEVEGTSKKTALGGITGNKGGVAIGFKYASTKFMFINSHLAAGVHNLEDRHNDYKLLANGLRLNGGRRMRDADTVVWLGDFNYRVDLPNDTVRNILELSPREEAIARLLKHDQLTTQMERGETFPYFNEQRIDFLPTYKFDPGTSVYDTSDKQRVPSWTDRILTRGANIKPLAYDCVSSITFSDHRPVYALFEASVSVIDEERADELYSELYSRRRHDLLSSSDGSDAEAKQKSVLPHPSTDARKWWAGGGLPTKVPVNLGPNMVLNPDKINPFGSTLPDAVPRPRAPPPPRARAPSTGSASSASSTASRRPVPSPEQSLMDAPLPPPPRGSDVRRKPVNGLMDADTTVPYKSLL